MEKRITPQLTHSTREGYTPIDILTGEQAIAYYMGYKIDDTERFCHGVQAYKLLPKSSKPGEYYQESDLTIETFRSFTEGFRLSSNTEPFYASYYYNLPMLMDVVSKIISEGGAWINISGMRQEATMGEPREGLLQCRITPQTGSAFLFQESATPNKFRETLFNVIAGFCRYDIWLGGFIIS